MCRCRALDESATLPLPTHAPLDVHPCRGRAPPAPGHPGDTRMKPSRHAGRRAARILILLTLSVAPAWAGPRPELDVTAGMRPGASLRALAASTRANASLLRLATPAVYDQRYEVPTFLWATRDAAP